MAPIYGHEVPAMVREFLEKATFQTPYFYMILTYGNATGAQRSWPRNCVPAAAFPSATSTSSTWWTIGCPP